jgi:outer membrane protein OmpA-like peptidoglycan-associated protein
MTRVFGTLVAGVVTMAMATTVVAAPAPAAEPAVKGSATLDAGSGKTRREARTEDRAAQPWIKRWRPERHLIEAGLFGGVFLASDDHDLYDPRTAPQEPLWAAAPDLGVRLGYFPLRPLGVEAEFSAVPHRVRSITNDFAFVYGFRAHAIAQLPYYNVVPFFLAGYGLMGVRSNILILGDDVDPAFHYGGGVKVFFNRWVGARVEARNIITAAEARQDSGASHVQILAGVTFTFNRAKQKKFVAPPPPPDPDRDKDGILNEADDCPDQTGVEPHGCPDTDGDGFRDSADACPEVPGVKPDGCPPKDTDGDGFLDHEDACPREPETFNGYQDQDGCPDELPAPVREFNGTIEGIVFDFNKDTIRASSKPVLDRALETLKEWPEIRVKIIGHTDDVGTPEVNQDLSRRRAEAVKQYLIEGGVDASRVETEGRGATEPRAPNDTEENRAKNRRIEFNVLQDEPGGGKGPADAPASDAPAPNDPDAPDNPAADDTDQADEPP